MLAKSVISAIKDAVVIVVDSAAMTVTALAATTSSATISAPIPN
jgi:hypothetical protein